jgi:hypothetical protein
MHPPILVNLLILTSANQRMINSYPNLHTHHFNQQDIFHCFCPNNTSNSVMHILAGTAGAGHGSKNNSRQAQRSRQGKKPYVILISVDDLRYEDPY